MVFKVKNKYKNLSKSPKLFLVLLVGFLLCFISYFLYNNFIILLTTILSVTIIFFYLIAPTKEIEVEISDEGLRYDKVTVAWSECVGWSVVNLENQLEFVIHTSHFVVNFYYFYLPKDDLEASKIAANLSQLIPYNQDIADGNYFQKILRAFDLI